MIFPMPLVDTLLRAAEKELYRLHFSQEILDGATRNLVKRGKMPLDKAQRFQRFILNAFPDSLIEVPEGFEAMMTNHPGDRHVLAAAVVAKADVIVTSNLKHFPNQSLEPWHLEVQHPDIFLNSLSDFYGDGVLYNIVVEQALALKNPPQTAIDLLERFEREQPMFASRMLLHGHGPMVGKTARTILDVLLPEEVPGNRTKSGNHYEISEIGQEIVVSDKYTNREILRKNGTSMTGQPLRKHILDFEEMKQVVEPWIKARLFRVGSFSQPFSR
ncbi:MAG: PIN domain-containing protein [Thermosynechococcaceae cyanobacterium MS004]|nr:PIN domain-containing protein [Thermosynechococcaceae cyanobacterium MS004]